MNKVRMTANILFSGVGMQERGIESTGLFNLKVVSTSEIDKYAILSYAAVHHNLTLESLNSEFERERERIEQNRDNMIQYLSDKKIGFDFTKNKMPNWGRCSTKELYKFYRACEVNHNIGDIASCVELPCADLWTYSFPCTDISISGGQKGVVKNLTRSGLVYEVTRLLETAISNSTSPKYLLMENVDALVSKKFKSIFETLIEWFDEHGYNTYWQILNAKDHGVPQNRKRVFALHIRKDVDNGRFEFPKPYDSGIRLRDMLDENVDEKYYLSEGVSERFHSVENRGQNIVGSTAPPVQDNRMEGFSI